MSEKTVPEFSEFLAELKEKLRKFSMGLLRMDEFRTNRGFGMPRDLNEVRVMQKNLEKIEQSLDSELDDGVLNSTKMEQPDNTEMERSALASFQSPGPELHEDTCTLKASKKELLEKTSEEPSDKEEIICTIPREPSLMDLFSGTSDISDESLTNTDGECQELLVETSKQPLTKPIEHQLSGQEEPLKSDKLVVTSKEPSVKSIEQQFSGQGEPLQPELLDDTNEQPFKPELQVDTSKEPSTKSSDEQFSGQGELLEPELPDDTNEEPFEPELQVVIAKEPSTKSSDEQFSGQGEPFEPELLDETNKEPLELELQVATLQQSWKESTEHQFSGQGEPLEFDLLLAETAKESSRKPEQRLYGLPSRALHETVHCGSMQQPKLPFIPQPRVLVVLVLIIIIFTFAFGASAFYTVTSTFLTN